MLQNFGQTRTLPQKFGVFKKLQEFLNFYGVLWQILLEFGKYSIFQSYLEFYFKYSWWNFFLEYCISKLRNSDQVTGPWGGVGVWSDSGWLLSGIAREVCVGRGSGRSREIPRVVFGWGAPGVYFSVLVVFY